jgi:hypothetical protein
MKGGIDEVKATKSAGKEELKEKDKKE